MSQHMFTSCEYAHSAGYRLIFDGVYQIVELNY